MADHYHTAEAKRLLALRSALPVLLLMVPCLVVAARMTNWSDSEDGMATLGLAILAAIAFLVVYGFRLAYPNKNLWLEPGFRAERPAFSLKAAIGASIGVYVASCVLATSLYYDPWPGKIKFNPLDWTAGGATAGVVLGVLVFSFAGVLYLRVHCDKAGSQTASSSGLPIFFIMLAQSIHGEMKDHAFWVAVGMGTWFFLSVTGAILLGILAYTHIAVGAPNLVGGLRKSRATSPGR